jgi:hypothetical protein
MSNYLAIATVTAGLVQLLHRPVADDVPGAGVTFARPDGVGGATPSPGVNLYLYQVTPNLAYRNADLPTRNSRGELVQRPRVALDLHYLFTFYGDETRFEPQRVLGSVVRTMHERPVFTRQLIYDAIHANPAELGRSNLADAIESVKFVPDALSLEELSKLWSVFFQVPYALSAAYHGTLVLIEGEETPRSVLPVRERNLYVIPFRQPVIEEVTAGGDVRAPIVLGSTLVVSGRQLRGDDTLLRIAGIEVPPGQATPGELRLQLGPPDLGDDELASLRAGVHGVQVVHRLNMGTPPAPHGGIESNVAPFVLRPTIENLLAVDLPADALHPPSPGLAVDVDLPIGKRQRVVLLLNEWGSQDPAAYTFAAEPRPNYQITAQALQDLDDEGVPAGVLAGLQNLEDQLFRTEVEFLDAVEIELGGPPPDALRGLILRYAGPEATARSHTVRTPGVQAGDYLVRLQIDGAESLLIHDPDPMSATYNQFVEPRVTFP